MARRKEIEQAAMRVVGVHPDWGVLECFRVGYKEGAKWADETMIEKACEWLMHNVNRYINDEGAGYFRIEKTLFDHFRKAMED